MRPSNVSALAPARALALVVVLLLFSAAGAFAQSAPAGQPQPGPSAPAPSAPAPSAIVTPDAPPAADNPYGFAALWNNGDAIARGTVVVLLIMSVGSWYILVTKLVEQVLLARHAQSAEQSLWGAPTLRHGANALAPGSAFRGLVEEGLHAATAREGTLVEQIDAASWITLTLQHSVETIGGRMQRGLAFLATVGSTAPFVGLFGTVWGIYHALTAIGIAGQASIDKVAGPVGEALIMTAMGLAVAVPAVLGYNWLNRRNKVLLDRVRAFAGRLHAVLVAQAGAPAASVKRSA